MRILKDQSVLVVVDIQERLFPLVQNSSILEQKCETLIKGCKALGLPIVVTEQYTKGLGYTIPKITEAVGENSSIEKMAFSCCGEANFNLKIEEHYKENIILCGIESHVCVMQTAIDLIKSGHQPIIVVDAVSSRNSIDKEIAFRRLEKEGAILATTESILFELCRESGTETFKAISRLVK